MALPSTSPRYARTPSPVVERWIALQRDTPARQQAFERDRLARLVHALPHVPFYRELYGEHGVRLDEIQTADDLWKLPCVTKRQLVAAGVRASADERLTLSELRRAETSGSMGAPLSLFSTLPETALLLSAMRTPWLEQGATAEDRYLMVLAPYLQDVPKSWRIDWVPPAALPEELLARFVALQATVIVGSVEAIALLARTARESSLPERDGVRLVFPLGQTFDASMRAMVTAGFPHARVFDTYGSQETSWIGVECEAHAGHHLPVGRVVAQVARLGQPDVPAEPGELGEVIVTSLLRTTSPVVRYRLGDAARVELAPCLCGRTTPRLASVEGRVQDFLISTSGALVPAGNVSVDLGHGQPNIKDFRIVQEAPERIRVQLVVTDEFEPSQIERSRQVVLHHLGPVEVRIDVVDKIEADPGKKLRRVYRAFPLPGFE